MLQIAEKLVELGAEEITVADTVGYGNPGQVDRILKNVLRVTGKVPVAAHFHDSRGLGLANVGAALNAGVRRFDASLGGLGGCPFAPGATGNIDTEDTVFMLESLGYDTGIDIEALLDVRRLVQSWMPNETFYGALARSGLPKNFRRPVALGA